MNKIAIQSYPEFDSKNFSYKYCVYCSKEIWKTNQEELQLLECSERENAGYYKVNIGIDQSDDNKLIASIDGRFYRVMPSTTRSLLESIGSFVLKRRKVSRE